MLLDCMVDFIGVEGCSTTTPLSGLYINQLPGIELKMIDQLADEQQVDFNGVWDDVQERAIRGFMTDVNQEFRKKYKLKTITQNVDMGRDIDTSSTTAAGAFLRGFTRELDRNDSEYAYSNLQSHRLQSLDLYFSATKTTTIYVFDMDLGTQLYSQAIAAPAAIGWQRINIYQDFTARRIFVCYDATNLVSVEFNIDNLSNRMESGACSDCGSCGSCLCGSTFDGELRGASAPLAATVLESAMTVGSDSFGLGGIFSTVCSYAPFVCDNRETFATAFWYKLGIELMWERAFTSRVNEFTAFDKNKAKEAWKLLEIQYRGGAVDDVEIEGELMQVIDGVNLDLADYCIECHASVQYKEMVL